MESHGTVCEWEGDKLTAWVSTQGVNSARDNFARGLGDSADERPRHLSVHGRRLRQQAAARPRRTDLRAAREAGGRAGEDDARSQGRASRDRQPSVRGGEGQGGRRRPTGTSRRSTPSRGAPAAPVRTRASRCPTSTTRRRPTSAPRAQGRVHQHRPAAPDARAGPPAGIVHHRGHDGRARGSREDGSDRVPDQEPAAGSAERDVAQLPARRRRGVRLEQAASDR